MLSKVDKSRVTEGYQSHCLVYVSVSLSVTKPAIVCLDTTAGDDGALLHPRLDPGYQVCQHMLQSIFYYNSSSKLPHTQLLKS